MVVWNINWLCVVPLCVLSVGQWGLTLQSMYSLSYDLSQPFSYVLIAGIVTRAA